MKYARSVFMQAIGIDVIIFTPRLCSPGSLTGHFFNLEKDLDKLIKNNVFICRI